MAFKEETSDVQTYGKGALSLIEFLSKNECIASRKSHLSLVFTPVSKMLAYIKIQLGNEF